MGLSIWPKGEPTLRARPRHGPESGSRRSRRRAQVEDARRLAVAVRKAMPGVERRAGRGAVLRVVRIVDRGEVLRVVPTMDRSAMPGVGRIVPGVDRTRHLCAA